MIHKNLRFNPTKIIFTAEPIIIQKEREKERAWILDRNVRSRKGKKGMGSLE
jgi:hypothetical protein